MPFDTTVSSIMTDLASYVCSDQGATLAQEVAEQGGTDAREIHGGGLSGAARVCGDTAIAKVVLAEIGNIPVEMACECVTEIRRTGAEVIVIGDHKDIATYRALRHAGATEYFSFPVTVQDILAVQAIPAPAVAEPHAVAAPVRASSIAVIGSNGGVGTSLLAQNLAFFASDAKGANLRTALIDADIRFGSQAIDLDQDETYGLFEALKSPGRVDETFMAATMAHINDKLSLYSNQIGIGQDPRAYEAGIAKIIPPMREGFGAVITDLPRDALIQDPDLASQFDAVILLVPAGFSGVNAASRLIARITAQNPTVRILPVLSELRKDAGLSQKDIAGVLETKIAATLPRCDGPLASAHRAASPLIQHQPGSPYAKVVRTIWAAAVSAPVEEQEKAPRSFIKRFFK